MRLKVLVTGITGFIGSHTAIQLIGKGYDVIGTTRNAEKGEKIKKIIEEHTGGLSNQLKLMEASLTDPLDIWRSIIEGIDFIMHIASPLPRIQPRNSEEIITTAKEGVLNVLKVAAEKGVKRVVLTSSTGAISQGVSRHKVFTEEDWTDEHNLKDVTPYYQSKTIAEKAAWEFIKHNASGLELSVINPSLVLGPVLDPEDYGVSAALIFKLLNGDVPALPNVNFSLVDVRSIADLHIRAMESENAAGERFLGTGKRFTMKEVADVLRNHFPTRKFPKRTLPDFLVRLFALIDKEASPVTLELGADRSFDASKAKKLLSWQPLDETQAIIDTAESLLELEIVK